MPSLWSRFGTSSIEARSWGIEDLGKLVGFTNAKEELQNIGNNIDEIDTLANPQVPDICFYIAGIIIHNSLDSVITFDIERYNEEIIGTRVRRNDESTMICGLVNNDIHRSTCHAGSAMTY